MKQINDASKLNNEQIKETQAYIHDYIASAAKDNATLQSLMDELAEFSSDHQKKTNHLEKMFKWSMAEAQEIVTE